MATIREKRPQQWQAQIRRKGWPTQNATFRTKRKAQAWARQIESEMDRGHFHDQTFARSTTLSQLLETYLIEVTANRPSKHSRKSEAYGLKRFLREEKALCSLTVNMLKPEHFEAYRDRRLLTTSPRQTQWMDTHLH